MDTLGCMFQLAKPAIVEAPILFSLRPIAERLANHINLQVTSSFQAEPPTAEAPAAPSEPGPVNLAATYLRRPGPAGDPDSEIVDNWPIYQALRQWQSSPQIHGLSKPLTDDRSYLALDYSDIFETGRAPYKGGHGVSLFLRHDF